MLKKIQSYFLTLRAAKAARNNATERQLMSYDRAKNVGVLFGSQYEGKDALIINQFFRKLREEGKQVKSLTYFPQERSNPFDFKFDFFTSKEVSWLGEVKSDAVDRFVDTPFDYLFYINEASFLPFEFILAQSKAQFRISTLR